MTIPELEMRVAELKLKRPDATDLVLLEMDSRNQKQRERQGVVSVRCDESLKELFYDTLKRIGARIGNQRKHEQLEFMVAETIHILDNGDAEG